MRITNQLTPRFTVSMLPPEVDPEEKAFARLLTQALAPSFVLVRRLGAGGMGAVYLARDPLLRRLVAVKVLAPNLASDPEARARFEREGQAVAAISHPNVVAVHSVGELENGVPYIVMQYIEGRTMAERLKEDGPLDARSAKHVIGEVASALAAAHKKGIIHRDIKPANILLDEDTGRAMVTDFGIAAVKEPGKDRPHADLTQTGTTVGTPAYMSPEQILAQPVTEKTDIYSLGLLAYELFIAEGPYQASAPHEYLAAHVEATPRPLHTMRGDVEPELQRLIESCLTKDPKQRPSAAEVEKRLEHGASILLEWPPPGLETLRPMVRTALRILFIGAFGAGIPIVLLSVFDRHSLVRQSLPPAVAMLVVTGIGLLTFGAGLAALLRAFNLGRAAVSAGYGWMTVLETVADKRGDTGALIAGAREYAELTPKRRNALRWGRLAALVLRLFAGIAPVVGYLVGMAFFSAATNGPTIVLWSSILLAVTLILQARAIGWMEDRAMAEPRRRLRSAHARPNTAAEKLAETWTASFDQVRAGQGLGAGVRWSGKPIRLAVIFGTVGVAAVAMFLFMMVTLTTLVGLALQVGVPKYANTAARVSKVRRLETYRIPVDSTITPLRAGQALHAITRDGPGGTLRPFEKPPAITIPAQPRTATLPDPFPLTEGGWANYAFRSARRGFSAEQRDFLRSIADNSAIEEFRVLARAPGLDIAGAMWDLQNAQHWMQLPMPRFGTIRKAANANIAQAALDVAAGRTGEADRRLREVVSVGFLMINDGHTLMENLIGAAIVGSGRTAMASYYEVAGRDRDARFVSTQNDPELPSALLDERITSLDDISAMTRARVLDSTALLGLRWEFFHFFVSAQPCSDMHQIVFGPDSLQVATIAEARSQLARRSSDSLLFDMAIGNRIIPITATGSRGAAVKSTLPVTRTVGLLTGSRQFEACMSLFGG